jgi:competence protein ComEC
LLGLGIGYKLYQKKQFQKISTHNIEQTIQNDILTDTVKQNVKTDMQSKSTKSEDEFKISYVDKKPDGITSNYTDVSKTYGKLKVVFVDVGQGDAAIIVTPAKKCYIIDTGENNSDGKKIVNILSKLGVTKIDVMVLTHPHADHIGGAYYIMKNFKVQEIWDSGKPYTTRTYKRILSEIKRQNIGYKIPQRGDKFNWASGIKIKVLNPVKNSNNSTNNYSIVIQLKYGNTSFMFTGDMEKEVEHELIKQFGSSLKSDILKVGHHCSHTSSTKTFLDAVNPDYCVICVGSGNRYGHPHNSTFDRLHNYTDKIYRTDNHGNIYMQTDGNNIEIKYDKNIDFISFNLFILNKEVEKIG